MPHDTPEKRFLDGIDAILRSVAGASLDVHFPRNDEFGNPRLARFLLERGRLPFIEDEIKPWLYRGWLIPYVQLCENHREISPRYDYVLRTLEAGCLLDEPIPYRWFVGEFDPRTRPGLKMLEELIRHVEYKSGSWNGMREFCEWLGFGLGVTTEPSKLDADVQQYLYRNFNLQPLLLNPSDYLGQLLTESSYGKRNAFYPTPVHVSFFMNEMIRGDEKRDRRAQSVMDPAVGTGRMLLVASNYSLRLFGQDIDYLCCLVCKINLALYAPWFYIPEGFFESEENEQKFIVPQPDEKPVTDSCAAEKPVNKQAKKYTTEIIQPSLFDRENFL